MMPSVFSLQGIKVISKVLDDWKRKWEITGKAISRMNNIDSQTVLSGKGLLIGYIINSYNQYSKKPIDEHYKWIEKIKIKVVEFFAGKHTINGLSKIIKEPLQIIKDYGQLSALCDRTGEAIFELDPKEVKKLRSGTEANLNLSKDRFRLLGEKLLEILNKY